ncbi:MAG: polyhydroxyalkanoic acid system family protein [Deltaproteobacteria bacterium]|nr:polyhydroxyalkanoic acid system family protein [Deltaproteobacteria bacterium]
MPEITIDIPHTLSRDEVRGRLERMREKLENEYGVACTWQGEALKVQRSGLDGTVAIEDDRLTVRVKLGMLMGAFSSKIRDGITQKLTRVLNDA